MCCSQTEAMRLREGSERQQPDLHVDFDALRMKLSDQSLELQGSVLRFFVACQLWLGCKKAEGSTTKGAKALPRKRDWREHDRRCSSLLQIFYPIQHSQKLAYKETTLTGRGICLQRAMFIPLQPSMQNCYVHVIDTESSDRTLQPRSCYI